MNFIIPPSLRKGDTIGLIAPSSPLRLGRLEIGSLYLQQQGFKVKVGAHLHDTERFLAGTDAARAQDIMDFFMDREVNAIMATAGGYGSQRLLPLLDYAIIQSNPKLITGFSDTTALQLGILKKAGLASYTGFTFRDVDTDLIDPFVESTFLSALFGQAFHVEEGIPVHAGIVQAPLIGGNLECLVALMGTPYQPDFNGNILLIEDVMAEPYQTDCRLSQLALAGVFEQVAGVVFGDFVECIAKHSPERDGTIEEVIDAWSKQMKVPCLKNFPYGHGKRRCVLPIGKEIILDANKGCIHIL
jgi:muramoyltetrapeptide carboxypeptidase